MVVDQVPRDFTDEEIDRIFGALADTTRRDILRQSLLGEQSVSGLARNYAMSFAAVQKHVAVLERALLVTKERRGREQIVHSNPAVIRRAARLLDAYEDLWRDRIARIGDILSGPPPQENSRKDVAP
ncbi:transcriptional regulator [Sinomonas cellulolyticus]|uniref:Helix-turn-helix transcriptional regulator n=1 Tax=Sinomonas cellulolyticus TaxID=2801916 RepID=A0ABS1K215_9MICC|nr:MULTISPECIES: helix-turn-helix transcriptional regulator [Sinomonas]MBL0705594.1 helix-turn-helix transcriptional regulator [Sinomonas cellulolyticus]GHG51501.1 transcriptional regulator [Sinomonas sp. KCTC 49339]